MFLRNSEMCLFLHICLCMWYPPCNHFFFFEQKCSIKIRRTVVCGISVSASASLNSMCRSSSSCGKNSNACVVDHYRGMTRPQVVICAVYCCISTNLFQRSMNDGNYIAMQSLNLDVSTLFRLRSVSWEIFCFIFGQLWHGKISMKQPWKLPPSLCNSSDYTLLANKTWFQPVFLRAYA